MSTQQIFVENIKCSGCINSIKTALMKLKGVSEVKILKEEDLVSVTGDAFNEVEVLEKLATLGYPEKGNNNLMSKAKSMVSCAIGRIS